MPLVRSFWLGKKKGKERYVIPIPDGKRVRFEIGGPDGVPREGTVGRTGAVCLLCGTPVPLSYIRAEGKAGRMGAQLMAIAAEGKRQRYYVAPTEEHEKAADVPRPIDVPEAELPDKHAGSPPPVYGMRTWADLFTNRQLIALTTFSDLVQRGPRSRRTPTAPTLNIADAIATYLASRSEPHGGLLHQLLGHGQASIEGDHAVLSRVQAITHDLGFRRSQPIRSKAQPTISD